ncbi:MAG TPA: hypothetical protein VFN54_03150 [Acidimicrobiales bacterium]|nr:hypothetical protein [Acidimicrobiales bacterium]
MYRSTATKVKRASVWSAAAALSIAGAVAAAHLASTPHPAAARATSVTPAPSVATSTASTSAPARPVSLSTPSAPTPRVVLAVSTHSISVRGVNGVVTYSLTPSTAIVSGTSHVTVSSIHAGMRVIVVASPTVPSQAATIGVLPVSGGEGEGAQGFDQ